MEQPSQESVTRKKDENESWNKKMSDLSGITNVTYRKT